MPDKIDEEVMPNDKEAMEAAQKIFESDIYDGWAVTTSHGAHECIAAIITAAYAPRIAELMQRSLNVQKAYGIHDDECERLEALQLDAKKIAAYEELHRASRALDKLGGILGDDDVLTHEERRAVVEFKAALAALETK